MRPREPRQEQPTPTGGAIHGTRRSSQAKRSTREARKPQSKSIFRRLVTQGNIIAFSLLIIAACLATPYIYLWLAPSLTKEFRLSPQRPPGAPKRPSSTIPSHDERVRLDIEWRRALEDPFRELQEYSDKLESIEQSGISKDLYYRIKSKVLDKLRADEEIEVYQRLSSDLSSARYSSSPGGRFDQQEIARLEEQLLMLQAKLRAAKTHLDRQHDQIMELKRKFRI